MLKRNALLIAIALGIGIATLNAQNVTKETLPGVTNFARLETTVTPDAVVVSFHGLWPTRTIKLDDIASFEPMHYTMWDSGGWGVHFGLAGMTYNVSGNDGVHFRLTDGRRVLVGTQRPAEFASGIAKAMAARPPA